MTQLINDDVGDDIVALSVLSASGADVANRAATYDAAGNQVSVTDPTGATSRFTFDAQSRLTSTTTPGGAVSSLRYDPSGNAVAYVDPLGRTSTATYDAAGHRTSLVEPAATSDESVSARTWSYGYDASGRQVTSRDPVGRTVTTSYDADSNVIAQAATGPAGASSRSFTFDALDRMIGSTSSAGTEQLTYDQAGRLLTSTGISGTSRFGYDGDGNVLTSTDASGTSTYTWTAAGRAASATVPGVGTLTRGYDRAGQVTSTGWGTTTETLTHDALGDETGDTVSRSGTVLQRTAYAYDASGRRTSRTSTTGTSTATTGYTYDSSGRLTSWTDTGTHTLTWDAANEVTSQDGAARSYDGRGRLTAQGSTTYGYDSAGDRVTTTTSSGTVTHDTYDSFGQLTQAGSMTVGYDASGRVVQEGGQTVAYAGTGSQPVQVGTGDLYRRWADGSLIGYDSALALTDAHGDVTGTLTTTGIPTSTTSNPFGATSRTATPDLSFQGALTTGTGLVHLGARWYDPTTGTFLTRDVATLPLDQQSRYTYGQGDPVNTADPSGHCAMALTAPACVLGGTDVADLLTGLGAAGDVLVAGAAVAVEGLAAAGSVYAITSWIAANDHGGMSSYTVDLTGTGVAAADWAGSIATTSTASAGTAVTAPSLSVPTLTSDTWSSSLSAATSTLSSASSWLSAAGSSLSAAASSLASFSAGATAVSQQLAAAGAAWAAFDAEVSAWSTTTATAGTGAWVAAVTPIGVAASASVSVCAAGGSAACHAAAVTGATTCAGPGAPTATACLPQVSGLWAPTPTVVTGSGVVLATAAGTGASAAGAATNGSTPGVQNAGCPPGQLATSAGCESPLQLLQRKVTDARNRLANNQQLYQRQLYRPEFDAEEGRPWVRLMNHGKAVERLVADDPEIDQFFEHVGPAGQEDFALKEAVDGVGREFEVTSDNPSTVASHLQRAYVAIERLATYAQW